MLIDWIAIALIIATARSVVLPTLKVESRSSSNSRSEIEAPSAENLTNAELHDELVKVLKHQHLPVEFNVSIPFEHKCPTIEVTNATTEDQNQTETETETETEASTLEPRRDFPDWSERPGGMAPCPGWPARTRFNETHWREWHFRCFCYRYGLLDRNCEMPYHYGWGNGQYDGDGPGAAGNVKCLKKTWWGCKEAEKPHRVQ